ncbi:polysaccharide pyruvyl transferase family protein [Occultella kanbiaonis]|uniref:polysaccharide pyruvyl transferase family protein n=1 Tax=Occultella kanbiaonis TaxID=2675754 RepID=UPI0013D45462|nr:polysaccharide pyruvyl transferase family protein [Occultella kanbiaonis]
MNVELVYYKARGGNFGDDLNEWLWDDLLPGWRAWDPEVALVGVGTILNAGLVPAGRKLVLGSGVGYGQAPNVHERPGDWDIRSVRGPKSATALDVVPTLGVVDPAVMISGLSEFEGLVRGDDVIFIPHHGSNRFDWTTICAGTGVVHVSPTGDSKEVIKRIATARAVIAESMHAAIIADAFGVPWHAVAISNAFNTFKWGDWAESLSLELRTTTFFRSFRQAQRMIRALRRRPAPGGGITGTSQRIDPASSGDQQAGQPLLASIARRTIGRVAVGEFQLSDRTVLNERRAAFSSILESAKRDYG